MKVNRSIVNPANTLEAASCFLLEDTPFERHMASWTLAKHNDPVLCTMRHVSNLELFCVCKTILLLKAERR